MEKTCPFCGKSFQIKPNRWEKREREPTCGKMPCFGLAKRKKDRMLIKRMCLACGKLFDTCMAEINRGRGMICSQKCYREHLKGNLNPNWKGGIKPLTARVRESDKMQSWKTQVFVRDAFTCFMCGKTEIQVEAHHIVPFSHLVDSYKFYHGEPTFEGLLDYEPLWSVANGVTLCEPCHDKIPKFQGKDEGYIPPEIWPVFIDRVNREGGIGFVARSVEDVMERLK